MSEQTGEPPAPEPGEGERPKARYVLITQCLQNDLFLDPECRLFIGDEALRILLLAKKDYEQYQPDHDPRQVPAKLLENGPLYLFLNACIGKRLTGEQEGMLHVINVRDWHVADDSYDAERRMYGRHCEAGTWGARYVDGLAPILNPREPLEDGRAAFCEQGNVRIYHVHADSIFDFRPRWDERQRVGRRFGRSYLERLMDILVAGSEDEVEELAVKLKEHAELPPEEQVKTARRHSRTLETLAESAVHSNAAADSVHLYVGVVGVYTDIKITILLAGLRARYEIANLATSDTLTASKSLERHLHGLDFADKLLGVEVIHGVGDMCRFLGTEQPLEDESDVVGAENYGNYRTFFAEKQSVLSYESEKLQQYAQLTGRRSIGVYETVKRANSFLLIWGSAFLTVSLLGTLLHMIDPDRWSWQLTVATGGIGLLQLVAAFFTKPMRDLQQNLNNLAAFRMILEGHSLKTAFARYHLTTPKVLRELKDDGTSEKLADAQVSQLARQLDLIDRFQNSDYAALERAIGLGNEAAANGGGGASNGAAAAPQPAPSEPAPEPAPEKT